MFPFRLAETIWVPQDGTPSYCLIARHYVLGVDGEEGLCETCVVCFLSGRWVCFSFITSFPVSFSLPIERRRDLGNHYWEYPWLSSLLSDKLWEGELYEKQFLFACAIVCLFFLDGRFVVGSGLWGWLFLEWVIGLVLWIWILIRLLSWLSKQVLGGRICSFGCTDFFFRYTCSLVHYHD